MAPFVGRRRTPPPVKNAHAAAAKMGSALHRRVVDRQGLARRRLLSRGQRTGLALEARDTQTDRLTYERTSLNALYTFRHRGHNKDRR